MEENDGRTFSHVEIHHALIVDRDGLDRKASEAIEPLGQCRL
jgi:hypothetical protein